MPDIRDTIIKNDRALAAIKHDKAKLLRKLAKAEELESGYIKDNCNLRERLQGKVLPDEEVETVINSNIELPKNNIRFEEIVSAFSQNEPTTLDANDNDDAFVRSILTRIQLGLSLVIKPVVGKERAVYLALDGSIVLFRKSEYKEKYKPNSIIMNVDLDEFLLFNNSDYCLLGRYNQSKSDGFRDWSIFDIRDFIIKEESGKIYLFCSQKQSYEFDVKQGMTPYIILRSEDGPPIIHSG